MIIMATIMIAMTIITPPAQDDGKGRLTMYDLLIAPFVEFGFMQRALAGSLMLSLAACPVGVFLMLRRMSLTGDAMAHAILPGAAAGFLLFGLQIVPMTIGGLIAGAVVAIGAGAVSRFTLQKEDASMAAFYLISLALGVMIVSLRGSSVDLMHVLFGTVLALDDAALTLIAGIIGDHARQPRHLLAGAGGGMPRPAVPALGQPARHADAFPLPRPRRAQSCRRLPGAGHAAVRRPDDAAGGRRALLDRPGRDHVRAGDRHRHCVVPVGAAAVVSRRPALRPVDHPVGRRHLSRVDRSSARAAPFSPAFATRTVTAPPDSDRSRHAEARSVSPRFRAL